jgi:acetolactate synthase I/II/III large subunit
VDLDPAEFGRSIPERAGLYGDVRTVLRKLLEALRAGAYGLTDGGVPFSGDPRVREIERCVRRIDEEADAWLSCDKVPINPFRVNRAARLVFPRETTVATDVGCLTQHVAGAFPFFRVYEPRSFIWPSTYYGMGFAAAAAPLPRSSTRTACTVLRQRQLLTDGAADPRDRGRQWPAAYLARA